MANSSVVDDIRDFCENKFYSKRKWIMKKAVANVGPIENKTDFRNLLLEVARLQKTLTFIDYVNDCGPGLDVLIKSAAEESSSKIFSMLGEDSIFNYCEKYFNGDREIPTSRKKKVDEKVDEKIDTKFERDPARIKDAVKDGPVRFSMRDKK